MFKNRRLSNSRSFGVMSLVALAATSAMIPLAAPPTPAMASIGDGTVVLTLGEVPGPSWASGFCLTPGTFRAFPSNTCDDNSSNHAVFFSAAASTTSVSLPAGTYNSALAEFNALFTLGVIGEVTVVAGYTTNCYFTLGAAPACTLGQQNGTVIVNVAESSGSYATGLCLQPGVFVLGSTQCTDGSSANISFLPALGTATLSLAPGNYTAGMAEFTVPTLTMGASGPVTVIAGQTLTCSFTMAAAPVCVGPDADGDGVEDGIDVGVGAFQDTNSPPTYGNVVDAAGLQVHVSDAANPAGVRVRVGAGAGSALFSACGFPVSVAAGSDIVITCGSVSVGVVAGAATIVLGDGVTTVQLGVGDVAKIDNAPGGGFTLDVSAGSATLVVDGVSSEVTPASGPVAVQAWHFVGFSGKLKSPPSVNRIEGGESVEYRFAITDPAGAPVTTLVTSALLVTPVSCSTWLPTGASFVGATRLTNQRGGRYMVRWKTPKANNGCYLTQLDIGDGVTHDARIKVGRG